MTKNPFLNALAAFVYISLVATFMNYGSQHFGPVKSVVVPIAMLSLFVFSAALMGYIFFYHPIRMYLDGSKAEAVGLFTKTLVSFGCLTIVVLAVLFVVLT